nr:MAG TPA: major capsid protein [Caudoviricetes sp.]
MEPDFSGYATKSGLRCSDGRTIMPGAFADQDGTKVPLVWQHGHSDPSNVLGHAVLENRDDGVYAYGFFNDSDSANTARSLVKHGDITAMSIFANRLVEKSRNVMHGFIREVSLVLSGANPGALIDNVNIQHSDGYTEYLEDEAVIYTGLELEHADQSTTNNVSQEETNMAKNTNDGDNKEKTVQDVFDSMTEEQQNVVYYMIGAALEDAGVSANDDQAADNNEAELSQSDLAADGTPYISHKEAFEMTRNVFEMANQNNSDNSIQHSATLSHSDVENIVKDARKTGSLKDAFLEHAAEYGIEDIDFLFPDARNIESSPEFLKRRDEWVASVMGGIKKSPFSRIKSTVADITADEARARGYVKGNLKKEEVIKLLRRKTEPTTIYKKQKLDRDDILDITDLDVISWIKAEMRMMLDEEVARAILIGDGRSEVSEDKIDEDRIRPIAHDDPMYAHRVTVPTDANAEEIIEALIRARANYRGSGQPTLFTTLPNLTSMLLLKDKMGRRLYTSQDALAAELMAKEIVTVEPMEQTDIFAIYVNLSDYTAGADKGGEVSMFDDFDIDYNQHKYLIETRMSGALTKPKSAVVIRRQKGKSVTPKSPSFNSNTNTVTIPSIEGVEYTIEGSPVTGDKVITATTEVEAHAKSGFSFEPNTVANWTFVPTKKNDA